MFTVVVLFGTEIASKVIGVAYSQRLAGLIIAPLRGAITLLKPVIFFTDIFSKLFRKHSLLSDTTYVARTYMRTDLGKD